MRTRLVSVRQGTVAFALLMLFAVSITSTNHEASAAESKANSLSLVAISFVGARHDDQVYDARVQSSRLVRAVSNNVPALSSNLVALSRSAPVVVAELNAADIDQLKSNSYVVSVIPIAIDDAAQVATRSIDASELVDETAIKVMADQRAALLLARFQRKRDIDEPYSVIVTLASPAWQKGDQYLVSDTWEKELRPQFVREISRGASRDLLAVKREIPGSNRVSFWVNSAEGLRFLAQHPLVVSIEENFTGSAHGHELAIQRIQSNDVIAYNPVYKGSNVAVAVIDYGIPLNFEPFGFGSRVIAEACFSSNQDYADPGHQLDDSTCPNDNNSQFGPGSARNDHLESYAPESTWWHGTFTSSIVASGLSPLYGVTPEVKIIAINIATNNTSPLTDPTKKLHFHSDDLESAISWLNANYSSFSVPLVAVNVSLGFDEDKNNVECGTLANLGNLHRKNVVIVASAGNNGWGYNNGSPGITAPACKKNVLAVGATQSDSDAIMDVAPYASNVGVPLDLFAPGQDIWAYSQYAEGTNPPVPDGGPGSGTSFAAPHVAGAAAILRSAFPNLTVSALEDALVGNGPWVTSSGISRRRLNVMDAYNYLIALPPFPTTPTLTKDDPLCQGVATLYWSHAVSAVTRYEIQASANTAFTNIIGTTESVEREVLVSNNQDAWYRVRGCNGSSCGTWSNSLKVKYYAVCP